MNMKLKGIFTDRSKAIIMCNYFNDKNEYVDDFTYYIEEVEDSAFDNESASSWTDMDLSQVPLDFNIDLKKDLKPNNFIYQHFEEEEKHNDHIKKMALEEHERASRVLENVIGDMKKKYIPDISCTYEKIKIQEAELESTHKEFLNARKNYKKATKATKDDEIDEQAKGYFEEISQKESHEKKELGNTRRKYTVLVKKMISETKNILDKNNVNVHITEFDHLCNKTNVHLFTLYYKHMPVHRVELCLKSGM